MSALHFASSRNRIIGLKRQDYKFASLHQNLTRPLEKPRSPTPEIDAPPKSDSSDEASVAVASEEDDFLSKKKRRKEHATNPSSGRSKDSATDNFVLRLRHSSPGVGENPGNSIGLQRSSRRRSISALDNDSELGMCFTQPASKRMKRGKAVTYTSERKVVKNIHEGSAYSQTTPKSTCGALAAKKSNSGFRKPNVDESMLAKGIHEHWFWKTGG